MVPGAGWCWVVAHTCPLRCQLAPAAPDGCDDGGGGGGTGGHDQACHMPRVHSPPMARAQVSGGWLWQMADSLAPKDITFKPVSEVKPTPQQLEDLKVGGRACAHVCMRACMCESNGVGRRARPAEGPAPAQRRAAPPPPSAGRVGAGPLDPFAIHRATPPTAACRSRGWP